MPDRGDPITPGVRGRIITLFCTHRGAHEARDVGYLFPDVPSQPITALSHSRRALRERMDKNVGHPQQPERCPVCGREPRLTVEKWAQIAADVAAVGESTFDVSYID